MDFNFETMLPDQYRQEAAGLYEQAFGPKLSYAIPCRADRIALLKCGFRSEFAFTAFHGKKLAGIAGYQSPSGSLTSGMTAKAILKQLGILHGAKACLVLSLFERKALEGELVMDGIAVHPQYRNRGLGTALLEQVMSYAATEDYSSVRLDVIDSNPKAKQLYTRMGFKETRVMRYPYLSRVLGFSGSSTMVYTVE